MHTETPRSISVRIVTVFILCFFAITIVLFALQSVIEHGRIKRRIQHDFDQLQLVYQRRLAEACQRGDDPLVRSILRGIYNTYSVGGAILESEDGSTAIAIGKLPEKVSEYTLLAAPLKREPLLSLPFGLGAEMRQFDLAYMADTGQVVRLGRVLIYANTSLLEEEFLDNLVFAGLHALVYFLGVSLILIFLVRRMVARPLGALAEEMKNVTKEDPEDIVLKAPVENFSELQTLFASFNFMLLSFISARKALRSSALAIEKRNRALSASEKKYRELFENAIEGMFLVAPNGDFIDANPALASLLGYTGIKEFKEIVRNFRNHCFVRPEEFDVISQESKTAFKTSYLDTRFQRKHGAVFWGTLAIRPFWDKELKTLFFRGSLVDNTERLLKQKAEKEKEAAKIASKAKGEFLAQMSHEIRTPMNGVIGLTRLALSSRNSDEQRELLQHALSSSLGLMHLLDEILDFSRIEAGMLELEQIEFSLEDIFIYLAANLGPEVGRKRLELIFDFAQNVPLQLIGDPLRLRQVLMNLASNAVKFTETGEIVIRSELRSQESGKLELEFSVFDTGIGMDQKQQAQLFKAFSQADLSIGRKYGGSGLGLVICARLVENMGGRIEVTSMPGKGSVFSFTARFFCGAEQKDQANCKAEFSGKKALVVDDNNSSGAAMVHLLERVGVAPLSCKSVAEAAASVSGAENRPVDYVFMNGNLIEGKEDDGFRVLKKAESQGGSAFILQSAFGPKLFRQQGHWEGPGCLLQKPVIPGTLCRCLREAGDGLPQEHLLQERGKNGGDTAPLLQQPQACEVLLVEDNEVNVKVATRTLELLGCRVTHAASGPEAVESVQTMRFDLVFMDIQMPGMDGYEAARAIRAMPRFELLPIIALTAHAFANERDKSLAAGMNEHLCKPLDPMQLQRVIDQWCRKDNARLPQPRRAKNGHGSEHDAMALSFAGIDMQDVNKRMLGDWSLLQDSLLAFRQEFSDFPEKLEASITKGDMPLAAHLTHTLKGASANISALRLQELAQELELGFKRSGDIGALFQRLKQQLAIVMDDLDKFEEDMTTGPDRGSS